MPSQSRLCRTSRVTHSLHDCHNIDLIMKILHVISCLRTGGAESIVSALLPRLIDADHQVELLVIDGERTPLYQQLEQQGITIHGLSDNRHVLRLSNVFKLVPYIRRYDIIHTHNVGPQFLVPLARLCAFSRTTLVTTEHSNGNYERGSKLMRLANRWVYNSYRAIIGVSPTTSANLQKLLPRHKGIITIVNGIDLARFDAPVKSLEGKTQFRLIMVARMTSHKDHATLLRAMALLPAGYHLQLAGSGWMRPQLEQLAAQLGVSDRVDFLGDRDNVPQLLASSDVNILSSHGEGLPLTCVEAMAAGLPTVASDVVGLHDLIGGAGLLFTHGKEQELADVITSLCSNPTYYAQVAQQCKQRAQNYDVNTMTEQYRQLYDDLFKK